MKTHTDLDLASIRQRDARDWPVISNISTAGRNYESTAALEALHRVASDRHALLAEVARLEGLVMVYKPVYESVLKAGEGFPFAALRP